MIDVDNYISKLYDNVNKHNIAGLLSLKEGDNVPLLEAAKMVKHNHIGNKCYFRGLIELSNKCRKSCYYCGIRNDNSYVNRYTLNDEDVFEAACYAYENGFGSIAIQAGEDNSKSFVDRIAYLVKEIRRRNNGLSITLSLGEQNPDTYKKWFDAGAERYLLRIETSNRELYQKIHPCNHEHSFDNRVSALTNLKDIGYQLGTGVMIGLPMQNEEMLAEDLIFMKDMNIDMCGMGPFIEHPQTPMSDYCGESIMSLTERLQLTFNMIAVLRIIMPNINIAATTALQAIEDTAREKALNCGANVVMPNITPLKSRLAYKLYNNKPISEDTRDVYSKSLTQRITDAGCVVALWESGSSKHYIERQTTKK